MTAEDTTLLWKIREYFRTGDGIREVSNADLARAIKLLTDARDTVSSLLDYGIVTRALTQDLSRLIDVQHARLLTPS